MAQFAVLVGCCYPDTRYALKGCYNDVETVQKLLKTRYGFDPENVEVLTDKPGFSLLPTGTNIKEKLNEMIEQAEPGDVLLFYFSGHGTFNDSGKGADCTRLEAIVPCDFNLLYSVDFRDMIDRVPDGADFVIVSDSCNCGGLIDNLKDQVGPGLQPDLCYYPKSQTGNNRSLVAKQIPITEIVQHLQRLTGLNSPQVGDHWLNAFGTGASLKYLMTAEGRKTFKVDGGILFSGCQFNEYSYDDGSGPRPQGKFTAALSDALKKHPGPISNKLLVEECRAILSPQHPCLFRSDGNADEPFLHES